MQVASSTTGERRNRKSKIAGAGRQGLAKRAGSLLASCCSCPDRHGSQIAGLPLTGITALQHPLCLPSFVPLGPSPLGATDDRLIQAWDARHLS